jgi:hypothetical protein
VAISKNRIAEQPIKKRGMFNLMKKGSGGYRILFLFRRNNNFIQMAAGSFSQIRSSELVVHKVTVVSWVVSASIVQSLGRFGF